MVSQYVNFHSTLWKRGGLATYNYNIYRPHFYFVYIEFCLHFIERYEWYFVCIKCVHWFLLLFCLYLTEWYLVDIQMGGFDIPLPCLMPPHSVVIPVLKFEVCQEVVIHDNANLIGLVILSIDHNRWTFYFQ